MKLRIGCVLACFAVAPLFLGTLARADSDGAYCAASGYLAYNLRKGVTPGIMGHVVRILRFGPEKGIYPAGEVTIEDFQVHQMYCRADRVEVTGWRKGLERYIIDVKDSQKVVVAEHLQDPSRQFDYKREPPETSVLWNGKPGAIDLESPDPEHQYKLLLSESKKTFPDRIETRRSAEVLQVDRNGKTLRRVLIYELTRSEGGE